MIKKITLISVLAVASLTNVSAATSVAQAFQNGKLKGDIKAYHFVEDYDSTGKSSIMNFGGLLNYKTDKFMGLQIGTTFQVSSSSNIDGVNKFVSDEDVSGEIMSELYLAYSKYNSSFKAGRQFISTPLIAGSGSRMIKQAFHGYIFTNTDIPATKISLLYVDKFQARTDEQGKPGRFSKTFNTNVNSYVRTLEDGAYSILFKNNSLNDLTLVAQYVDALDNFKTSYLSANYKLSSSFYVKAQYYGTTYDKTEKDGTFIAARIGGSFDDFSFSLSASENASEGNVESGLGYGADASFTGNEIYGGIFGYRNGSKAYQAEITTNIAKAKISIKHSVVLLDKNRNDDKETDISLSYNLSKNLNLNILHAIISGAEDYSRANANYESRLKLVYKF